MEGMGVTSSQQGLEVLHPRALEAVHADNRHMSELGDGYSLAKSLMQPCKRLYIRGLQLSRAWVPDT